MISSSPENYGYVQVERPILRADEFLSKVRAIGQRVLGEEYVSSLSGIEADNDFPDSIMHVETPIAQPVIRVVDDNDFNMVLLHRSAPPEQASRFSFGYVQNRLSATSAVHHESYEAEGDDGPNRRRARLRLPDLQEEMDMISISHNLEPDLTRVKCDRIDVIGEAGTDIVLGISPDNAEPSARCLQEQGAAAERRLAAVSKRTAYPASPWRVAAPFARIPGSVSDVQYGRLFEELDELTPVYFDVGAVGFSSKDRSK